MRAESVLLLAAAAAVFPAEAADVGFDGTAQLRAGYGSNPFLVAGGGGGSAIVGGTISPRLLRNTSSSNTILTGTYSRDEYLTKYGQSDTAAADLLHLERFSAKARGTVHAGYLNALNPLQTGAIDPTQVDVLTIGQRTRRLYGDAGLQLDPTERDNFNISGSASSNRYGTRRGFALASDYDQYGATGGYLRRVGPRTRIGLQFNAFQVDSKNFFDSTSYQPSVVLQQQLSSIWLFNGSVGAIFQKSDGPFGGKTTNLGFSGSLCGTYPTKTMCFTATRQSSASGIGGLRTTTRLGSTLSLKPDERSTITGSALFDISKATGNQGIGDQKFASARVDYSRDISRRLAIGASAGYQWREIQRLLRVGGATATANLTFKFGQLR